VPVEGAEEGRRMRLHLEEVGLESPGVEAREDMKPEMTI
jgi:hypothetical protein